MHAVCLVSPCHGGCSHGLKTSLQEERCTCMGALLAQKKGLLMYGREKG